jgi:hypothetical protein
MNASPYIHINIYKYIYIYIYIVYLLIIININIFMAKCFIYSALFSIPMLYTAFTLKNFYEKMVHICVYN